MKSKTFTCITKVLLLAVLFLFMGVRGWGQIVTYNLSTNGQAHPWPNLSGQSGTFSTNATGPNIASTCANATGWTTDVYWQTSSFSTAGFYSIKVSAKLYSQNTGPLNFSFEYKLGSGGTWTLVQDFAITSSLATYDFILPSACHDQSSVFVRWRVRNVTALGGGNIVSTAKSYIKSVSILGTNIVQASNISIVSITPTTITIACSPGTGDKRIVKMNTTNTFTDPTDNYNPTPSTTVYNDGLAAEQVMYNGGTFPSLTLTVANSTNEYWFRIYDYQSNSGSTRYITSTANENPKICALETITPTAATNISLTTAKLNATITDPSKMALLDRGIVWSATSGVSLSDNKTSEGNAATGPFSVDVSGLPRSTTIYFKGYVENESGIILSPELSFSNIPIFTGEGTWETAARWNVQEVPGENGDATYGSVDDSPIIDGICNLTADNNVTNLTINSGKILNINPDVSLTVNGDLTNNGGTAGLKLLSTATGTGSLIHNSANVDATVERYITGGYATGISEKYHQVSVPLSSQENYPSPGNYESSIWTHSYLFSYNEASNKWDNWDYQTNDPCPFNKGYLIYHPDWKPGTSQPDTIYKMKGELNTGSYTIPFTKSNVGFNLVPNPYPSAIDWDLVTKTGIDNAIWIFNPDVNVLNYEVYSNGVSLDGGAVNRYIPVGQAFFIKATTNGNLTLNYINRVHNTKDFFKSSEDIANVLHLRVNSATSRDAIAVRFAFDATTGHDSQYDAAKFYGPENNPQLYSTSENEELSINGLPLSTEATMVPLTLTMKNQGDLTFTASGMESFQSGTSIKLEDKLLNKITDLRINPEYKFTYNPDDSKDRFSLHFGSVLGIENTPPSLTSEIIVSGNQVFLSYPASDNHLSAGIFDLQGRLIKNVTLNGSGNDSFKVSDTPGVYLVRIVLPTGKETHKIVIL